MAKVTVVFTDRDEGKVNITLEADPPLSDETLTNAQAAAVATVAYAVKELGKPGTEEWEDE